jgi:hypothetical protein
MRKLILAMTLAAAGGAHAEDMLNLDLRAQFEERRANPANPYGVRDWSQAVRTAEVRWQWDGPLATAVRGIATVRSATTETARATLNELSFERALGSGFVSVGKKVMSWDVGYAFRPLDVVQQEDRRALYSPALEGVPMLAWETFGEASAVTVVISNPGHGQATQPRDDASFAARLYRHTGSMDQYAVMRASRRNGVEGGVSFSDVRSDGLELHGSALFQQRHDTWTGARWLGRGGGGKALAGLTWTTEGKFSLLAESWLDRTVLPGQQRNLLLRGSQDFGDLDLAADLLWQPRDGSRIAGLSLSWTPAPWAFNLSVRHYGGAAGTVVKRAAIATLQRSF